MSFIKQNFEIPIQNFTIYSIAFNGWIEVMFQDTQEDEWKYKLEIEGDYKIRIHGQEFQFSARDKKGYKMLIEFLNEIVKLCKTNKYGHFYLETKKSSIVEIEDSSFENWHFRVYKQNSHFKRKSDITGGVGQVSIYENNF